MKNIILFISASIFLLSIYACEKNEDGPKPPTISKISKVHRFESPFSDEIYLYSRISGHYKYSGNRLNTIVVETTNPNYPSYNFVFTYQKDGNIAKYKGRLIPGQWGGPDEEYFHYDNQGRVDYIFAKDNKKEGYIDTFSVIYDNNDKIIEYYEKTTYENARKFIYTWDGGNISEVKVIQLSYLWSDTAVVEAIVKFKYDNGKNPFKQESSYIFRPRYLSDNNPISDTTFKYNYQMPPISLISIDTIINSYHNTYNDKELISIKKNEKPLDIIDYVNLPK